MRPRVVMVLAVAAILLGGVLLVPAAYARLSGDDPAGGRRPRPVRHAADRAAHDRRAARSPTLAAGPVAGELRRRSSRGRCWTAETGKISGSPNSATATSSTESMIKVWIVSDYLRRTADREPPSKSRLAQASRAIRDSDDNAAQAALQRRRRRRR